MAGLSGIGQPGGNSGTTMVDDRVRTRRRTLFVTATVIDSLGSGLWVPFALLFLVHAQGLGLVEAGAALSGGALVALAAGPLLGTLMDRVGPTNLLLASNIVRAVAFACYPLVDSVPEVAVVAAVIGLGDRLFWTANAPLVARLTDGRESERLLGRQTVARFVGSGLGAASAAVLPVLNTTGFHVLAYVNSASFAVAALLVGLARPGMGGADRPPATPGTWATVLRDRAYVRFCGVTVLFTLCSVGKYSMLPILVTDVLHGPQWVFGTAMAIGTVVIIVGQQPILRLVRRWPRSRGLIVAAAVFTLSFATLVPVGHVPLNVAVVLILTTAALSAVAEAMFAPLTTATAAAAAPAGAEGRASALYQLAWATSQVAGPVLLTSLLTAGTVALWLTLAIVALSAIPAVLALRRRMPAGALD